MTMAEETFAGYQAYLIVERQAANQCPLPRDLVYDAPGGNVVRQNGVIFFKTGWTAPYNSRANVLAHDKDLVSWIFDAGTGEGWYYDGTQAPQGQLNIAMYWTPQQRAIGRVHNFKPKVERSVTEMPEIGSMYPAALKSNRYSNSFSFDKVWIDKKRIPTPTWNIPAHPSLRMNVDNQFSIRGEGLVQVQNFINSLKQNYYLTILYVVDMTGDTANVARTWLFPCSKYESVSIDIEENAVVNASLSGKATYCHPIPEDVTNIQIFNQSFIPTPP